MIVNCDDEVGIVEVNDDEDGVDSKSTKMVSVMITGMWFEDDDGDYIGFVVEHDDKDEYGENDEGGGVILHGSRHCIVPCTFGTLMAMITIY